ncbi:MAG: RIP metalloprotease RseP [Bacilli bacterium]|nr:RIP metalloprotease RseP [Bacilli bacterium]
MTIIYFVIILGITIMIHELGHFLLAKKNGVYIYEFAIGMGPQIFKFKRKNDETIYSIRLFPIGGFVSMAGEDMDDEDIPKDKQLINKSWFQKFSVLIAGVLFNFVLAIILLFIVGLINGVPSSRPVVADISKDYNLYNTNMEVGDVITKINETKVSSNDILALLLQIYSGKTINIQVQHKDGKLEVIEAIPTKITENDTEAYVYGFNLDIKYEYGIISSLKYSFEKTGSLINQMAHIIGYLITGKLSLKTLSGPVGIYQVVGQAASSGLSSVLYLIAYLCINVGFVNIIPIPAFDGGRILFLIIEKVKGSKIDSKIENRIHTIGFILLMFLMLLVTYNDILRIFK